MNEKGIFKYPELVITPGNNAFFARFLVMTLNKITLKLLIKFHLK